MNQGIHAVDTMCWLAGEVDSVIAVTDHMLRDIEVEDTANALLEFKNGAKGVIMGTTLSHAEAKSPEGDYIRIECEGGAIVYEGGKATLYLQDGDSHSSTKVKTISLGSDEELEADFSASDPTKIPTFGHNALASDLISAIIEDRDPYITGNSARKGVDVLLAIYQSSRLGKRVNVYHE
jgi:predicted dehydrogenase